MAILVHDVALVLNEVEFTSSIIWAWKLTDGLLIDNCRRSHRATLREPKRLGGHGLGTRRFGARTLLPELSALICALYRSNILTGCSRMRRQIPAGRKSFFVAWLLLHMTSE